MEFRSLVDTMVNTNPFISRSFICYDYFLILNSATVNFFVVKGRFGDVVLLATANIK